MASAFIGEIRMFAGTFAPLNWAFCNGQLLSIAENNALFALIGTTYGGDGQQTFGLPNLQSRIPIHRGPGFVFGQLGGTENVTLTVNQIPSHNHQVAAATSANSKSPAGAVYGGNTSDHVYTANAPSAQMNAGMVGIGGGSQPHNNMMPFVVVNFIIALYGIFPSQN